MQKTYRIQKGLGVIVLLALLLGLLPTQAPVIATEHRSLSGSSSMQSFLRGILIDFRNDSFDETVEGGYRSIYEAIRTPEYQTLISQETSFPIIYFDETGRY